MVAHLRADVVPGQARGCARRCWDTLTLAGSAVMLNQQLSYSFTTGNICGTRAGPERVSHQNCAPMGFTMNDGHGSPHGPDPWTTHPAPRQTEGADTGQKEEVPP